MAKIEEVRDIRFASDIAAMSVDLDDGNSYQLRVQTDNIGNTYVWIDLRVNGFWRKLIEIRNGEQREV